MDELWSPLKGNRRRNAGAAAYSMADKRAQVHDRSEKHMVVMSEKKRYGIRRRVAEQMRGQGVAFWQAFQRQFPADQDHVSFPNYKQKLQALGVVLSDEDFRHLWDLCSEQSQTRFFQGSEASSVASTGLSSSIQHADSMHAPESISLTQLAQTVGISSREDLIGSEDQEKEKKMKKKSAIVGQKVADSLKGRQKHLRQALKISDLRQEGKLDYHEFRACLQSAGIIIGDSDCKALVGDNRNEDTGQVDYEAFLSQISENDQIHRRTQHMFRDPTCESGGIGCDDRQSHTDATSDIFAQSTHESANSADDALANRHLAGGAFRDNPPQRAHSVQALQATPWEADPASAWEEKEPGAEKQKREAISLSKISNKLSAKMPELRRALVGDHGICRVSFDSFHEGLHKVGVVLHTADAKALYSRALKVDGTLDFEGLMRDRDGMPPMTSLRPSGVQGYTTSTSPGEGRAKSPQFGKRIEGEHMASRRGWANITKEALEIRDMGGGPMEEKWAMKISQSKVGNPFRLARMFRRYDTEQGKHSKTVLLDEFVQVMMDRCVRSQSAVESPRSKIILTAWLNSNLEVPRGEAIKLSQELDRGDGNINYMDFIRRVKGIKANGLPPTSPESEITPRNDSEIGVEFSQETPPLLQNQPGNIPSDLNGTVVSQASVATNETDKADKLGVVKKSLAFGSSQVECMTFKSCCLLHVLTCFGCRSNREIVGVGSKTWSKIVCGMWHIVSRPLVCERFPLQSVMALPKFCMCVNPLRFHCNPPATYEIQGYNRK